MTPRSRTGYSTALASALALSACLCAVSGAGGGPGTEIRGLWVVRTALDSPRQVQAIVEAARENGFNALFVQVRGRGETYYRSRIDPIARPLAPVVPERVAKPPEEKKPPIIDLRRNPKTPLDSLDSQNAEDEIKVKIEFDPLATLLDLAHAEGLKVHAWVNMYFTWSENAPHPSDKHVINRHPEWITADRYGVRLDGLARNELRAQWIEGLYLSPAIPEVRRYLTDVVVEIAREYPVDGIHMDYARYPGEHSGVDEYSREEFMRLHDFDPLTFLPGSGGESQPVTTTWAKDLEALWREWRCEQVTALVSSVARELRSCRPGIIVSAAVRPNPARAVHDFGQDWVEWLEGGLIDMAAPMIYTPSTPKFFESVDRMREAVSDPLEDRILAGISLYNQGPRYAGEKIGVARAAGLGGFVLFSYNSAIDWKRGSYLPSLKSRILDSEGLDRTVSTR